MLFKLSWLEFVEKIGLWNITQLSLTKIIREVRGDSLVFYLPTPEADYCTVINKKDMTGIIDLQLAALSIPGQRIIEEVVLDRKSIEEIKAIATPPNTEFFKGE